MWWRNFKNSEKLKGRKIQIIIRTKSIVSVNHKIIEFRPLDLKYLVHTNKNGIPNENSRLKLVHTPPIMTHAHIITTDLNNFFSIELIHPIIDYIVPCPL